MAAPKSTKPENAEPLKAAESELEKIENAEEVLWRDGDASKLIDLWRSGAKFDDLAWATIKDAMEGRLPRKRGARATAFVTEYGTSLFGRATLRLELGHEIERLGGGPKSVAKRPPGARDEAIAIVAARHKVSPATIERLLRHPGPKKPAP
jgi:hypothetical protein